MLDPCSSPTVYQAVQGNTQAGRRENGEASMNRAVTAIVDAQALGPAKVESLHCGGNMCRLNLEASAMVPLILKFARSRSTYLSCSLPRRCSLPRAAREQCT